MSELIKDFYQCFSIEEEFDDLFWYLDREHEYLTALGKKQYNFLTKYLHD